MNTSILNKDMIRFIRDEILDEKINIDKNTCIEDDLGISGIDADRFILSFSEKFQVDISDFNIDNYFEPEVSPFFFKKKERIQLTAGDLENAIRKESSNK